MKAEEYKKLERFKTSIAYKQLSHAHKVSFCEYVMSSGKALGFTIDKEVREVLNQYYREGKDLSEEIEKSKSKIDRLEEFKKGDLYQSMYTWQKYLFCRIVLDRNVMFFPGRQRELFSVIQTVEEYEKLTKDEPEQKKCNPLFSINEIIAATKAKVDIPKIFKGLAEDQLRKSIARSKKGPTKETILEEAQKLVHGERNDIYGPVNESFTKVSESFNNITGLELKPHHIPLIQIILKMVRNEYGHKRDNCVDGAGYFDIMHELREYEQNNLVAASDENGVPIE